MSELREKYKKLREQQEFYNEKANALSQPYWEKASAMHSGIEEAATDIIVAEFLNTVKWILREGHEEGRLVLEPESNEPLNAFFDVIYDGMHHGGIYLDRDQEIYFRYDDNEYQISFSSCELALEFVTKHGIELDVSRVKKILKGLRKHADNLEKLLKDMGK